MRHVLTDAWKKWKSLSQAAVQLQARIILGITYFTLLIPLGLWFRHSHDILRKKNVTTNWLPWPHPDSDREMKKM